MQNLKISICIPQYNRINYLLRSLAMIEKQTYPNIEISISDDCSSDNTVEEIANLIPKYKYPIIFDKNEKNMGYDRNYRKCIEMSSGDYSLVIGNDDSIVNEGDIEFLVDFLNKNNLPDIGFCNLIEERTGGTFIKRAMSTGVIGSGPDIALKNYSCFSFVGGLIYKRSTFLKYNTAKYDGSIYAQMYLGVNMIAQGAILFSIEEALVLKDMLLDGVFRKSYRDRIAKKWSDYKVVDGGLPSVINVLINALKDAGQLTQDRAYHIFKRIYLVTYPHWILDYKENGALPEAVGLVSGLNPRRNQNYKELTASNRMLLFLMYLSSSTIALLTPVFIFKTFKQRLYTFFKK
ncbi:MAG: glycosyltransferase family 2 protein [Cyclobacteriaceae bacterium]|nr:glycosyltransferase family 2 protein [Cyclobacteriaceae bacterium]